MPTCPTCGANLSPDWKFCIYCGTTVPTVLPRRYTNTGREIPSAIRPEHSSTPASRRRGPLVLGLLLGAVVVASIITLVVVFVATR